MDIEDFIIKTPPINCHVNSKGLSYYIFEKLLEHRNKTALICSETFTKVTFGEQLQQAVRTAIEMRKRKITPDDIVCLCAYNQMESPIPWIAALFLGCKVASLDPDLPISDSKVLLKQVIPRIIFVASRTVGTIEEILTELKIDADIVVFGETDKYIQFSDFLKPSDEEASFLPVPCKNIKDTALIVFSSGSTGLPKGICLNHYGLICQSQSYLTPGICFSIPSLYWISSINFLINSIVHGFARIAISKFDPNRIWNILEKTKTEKMFLPPHLLMQLVELGMPKNINLAQPFIIATGGSSISGEQIEKARAAFPGMFVMQAFGQTEISGLVVKPKFTCLEDYDVIKSKPDSCGCGSEGIWYKVVDVENEKPLGPYQRGELRLKSDYLLNGYYNLDSSDCWDENGWYKSGDVVYYDDDKWFYHVDRLRDTFKFRQWHIIPTMLEKILQSHPSVLNAVVIGKPDPIDGNHPTGFVQLKKNCTGVIEEEIKEYYNNLVEDAKKLRGGLKIVDYIPTSVTGKVLKKEFRKRITELKI